MIPTEIMKLAFKQENSKHQAYHYMV